MRRSVGWIVAVLALLVAALAGAFMWASSGWDGVDPVSSMAAEITSSSSAPQPVPGKTLRVMTWNVAFGGGGSGTAMDVHEAAEVQGNLRAQALLIREADADVVFLQEVDKPSDRSGEIDQFQVLIELAGYAHGCYITTWNLNYLPMPVWPPSRQIGRVHSGQAILSRYPIEECIRIPMPQPDENPSWYNRAYLHRSLQQATVRLPGGIALSVVNVHLESFSQSNREAQARILANVVDRLALRGPLVVAGDFNALPTRAAQKSGFTDEDTDFRTDQSIDIVWGASRMREVFLDDSPDNPEVDSFTFPSSAPTRRLDYIFAGGLDRSVRREVIRSDASDHFAVFAEFTNPAAP